MNRFHAFPLALVAVAGLAAAVPTAFAAESRVLADSTRVESWRLANGLRVVVRHVPKARAAAITFVVGGGTDHDPAGREGFAMLVSHIAYYSATGDVPERTREEMETLRPLGWSLKVTGDYTQFGEVVTPAQVPGVLHQLAQRFKGVTVSEAELKRAVSAVQADLAERYAGRADHALYYDVRELGRTGDLKRGERFAAGRGLAGVKVADVQKGIARILAPGNAVLSIAGNVGDVDLARLIEGEMGSLPSGAEVPHDTTRFRPAERVVSMKSTPGPVGAVGIIAPALTDTAHASFYLHVLLLGSELGEVWGAPTPPLTSRLQYPVLDDPGLVRFYPPIEPTDSIQVAEEMNLTIRLVPMPAPDGDSLEGIRRGIAWLFGGPLEAAMAARARNDASVLMNLSAAQGSRERWADEAFWAGYRERLAGATQEDFNHWRAWLLDRQHQVRLGFHTPAAAGKTTRR